MEMNVYRIRKCLSDLKGLKGGMKRPKTIRNLEDPPSQKRIKTSKKIGELILADRRLNTRAVAKLTGIDKDSVRQILHRSFNMGKVCAKMMPKLLTPEQKEPRMNISADVLKRTFSDIQAC